MSHHSLQSKLNQITRRLLSVSVLSAIAWALVTLGVALLIAVWLDLLFELSPAVRAAAPWCAGALAIGLAVVLVARRVRSCQPQRVARLMDETGGAGGVVLSGWELETSLAGAAPAASQTTSGLTRLAIASAAERAARIPASAASPLSPAAKSWGVLAAVVLVLGLLVLLAPKFARTEFARFAHPWDDVPPPSQTELVLAPGDVDVLYGDPLDIFAEVRGEPVDEVELVLTRGEIAEAVPMFQEADGRWRAVLARLTEPADYHVRAFRARSRRHRIGIITVPRIESLRVEVTPPAYAQGIGYYKGELPSAGVAGLPQTRVKITALSNRPLAGGAIALTIGQQASEFSMQLAAGKGDEVVGEFPITADGKFEVRVRDVDGQSSREAIAGAVTLLSDQRPFVRLLQPRAVSLATPSAHLPVELAGEDDYGVSRLELYRSLNDSRPLPLEIAVGRPAPRRQHEVVYLPLDDYGLSPGDQIKLFARIEDNDPSGAKGAESQIATVHIISQEEFERMLRAREGLNVLLSKYRQAQRMLESLREKNRSLEEKNNEKKGLVDKELRKQAEELAKQLRQNAEALAKAAQHALPYDADASLTPQLEELAKEFEQAAEQLERQLQRLELEREQLAGELEKLAGMLGKRSDLYNEMAMSPLEQLEQVMPLLVAQSRFTLLVQKQRDLAERLAALKGRDGEDNPAWKARMRDLEEEQRAIRRELDTLLTDIEEGARQLPEEEAFEELRRTALEFAAAVRESGAAEQMALAERGLAEFSGTRGHEHALKAAEILESFLSQCKGLGAAGSGCLVFKPGFGQCLGQTAAQLLAEMGLGQGQGGSGFGSGGGGYSARRGGNVGLYGGLPGMAGAEGGMSGRQNQLAADGSGRQGEGAGGENPDRPTMLDLLTPGGASGAGLGNVPLRYRDRVGQYFRRISAELQQEE